MSKIHTIVIKSEWYEDLLPWVERASKSHKNEVRIPARAVLRQLESPVHQRALVSGDWTQLSLSTKEAKFLSDLSEDMGLPEMSERFGIGLERKRKY